MKFYSTNHNALQVDFKTATIKGLAPDGGLYFPEYIPVIPSKIIKEVDQYSKNDLAFEVIKPYLESEIDPTSLHSIIDQTIAFDFPLVELTENVSVLELFHGPTLAFKDVGARFMSRCLSYFLKDLNKKITVLVATSGDTGGAVADGFYNVEGVNVVILYPAGKVSRVQEMQLTTYGKNIKAIEINGSFDDCQALVKQAFNDLQLNKEIFLTSANSISIARCIPQQLYYFFAYQQWKDKNDAPVISVPSGNFGNICAGLLAYKSGLPVKHFVAACNANDVVPKYFQTGKYTAQQSVKTISNAMDVGNPSNFVRILEMFKEGPELLTDKLSAYTFNDMQTTEAIGKVFNDHSYTTDPHGAVAFLGLKKYLENSKAKGIFLETAHPVKFPEVVEKVTGHPISIPERIRDLEKKSIEKLNMEVSYSDLKEFLTSNK